MEQSDFTDIPGSVEGTESREKSEAKVWRMSSAPAPNGASHHSLKTIHGKMNSSISGFWTLPSQIHPEEHEIMHISSAGRIVHLVVTETNPVKRYPMKLWCKLEGTNTYRVRYRPKDDGWVVGMHRDNQELVIQREDRSFRCKHLPSSIVPGWFLIALEQANLKMDSVEKDDENIEPDRAATPPPAAG
jgi:hypothetical protein